MEPEDPILRLKQNFSLFSSSA